MDAIGRSKGTPKNAIRREPEAQALWGEVGTQYILFAMAAAEIVGFVYLTYLN
jgi:hypothetical protein